MTVMLAPSVIDLQHLLMWVLITLGVSTVLFGIAKGVTYLEDLALLRVADTPEPQERKRLNAVIQFPPRRMQ